MAWNPYPYSITKDTLSVLWSQKDCTLSKHWREQVHSMILITPSLQIQLWHPKVLSILVARPLPITNSPKLLVDLSGRPHFSVLNNNVIKVAWSVSGNKYLTEEFLKKQPNFLTGQEEQKPWRITNRPGRSCLAGIINGKLIYLNVL